MSNSRCTNFGFDVGQKGDKACHDQSLIIGILTVSLEPQILGCGTKAFCKVVADAPEQPKTQHKQQSELNKYIPIRKNKRTQQTRQAIRGDNQWLCILRAE